MKVVLFREALRSPPVLCMAAHNVADPVCGTLFVDLDLVVDYKKTREDVFALPWQHFLR